MVKRGRRYVPADRQAIIEAATALCVRETVGLYCGSPTATVSYLRMALATRESECFAAVWLDNRHKVIELEILSQGTIDRAAVYPREVVKSCLRHNAAAVILAHNHPSGNLEPSQADELITKRLRECLALIEVRVLDHIILTATSHTAFSERGLL